MYQPASEKTIPLISIVNNRRVEYKTINNFLIRKCKKGNDTGYYNYYNGDVHYFRRLISVNIP